MAYTLMKKLITMGKSKDYLTRKANVYYAADQLTDAQYAELMTEIEALA